MRNLAAVAFAIGLLLGSQAFAQTGDYQAPKVGAVYTYRTDSKTEYETKIDSVAGFTTTWFTKVTGLRSQYAGLVWMTSRHAETSVFDHGPVDHLWPLEVGNTADFEITTSFGVYHNQIKVIGYEKVTVPAGEFKAYIIEWHQASVRSSWKADYKYWIVPGVGTVKYQENSADRVSEQELVSIKMP